MTFYSFSDILIECQMLFLLFWKGNSASCICLYLKILEYFIHFLEVIMLFFFFIKPKITQQYIFELYQFAPLCKIKKLLVTTGQYNVLCFHIYLFVKLNNAKPSRPPFRASLVAQWLRICLPMQGTRVRALVSEDPTCRGATRPVSHNY